MPHLIKYDLDGDGKITEAGDLQIVKNAIGSTRGSPKYNERWDFNHDGAIIGEELREIAQYVGKTIHGETIE